METVVDTESIATVTQPLVEQQVVIEPVINQTPKKPVDKPSEPMVQGAPSPKSNSPEPTVTASITQQIIGKPDGSTANQPQNVLNLGGSQPQQSNSAPAAAPAPLFNARIADNSETIDTEATSETSLGDIPVRQLSYLDTSGFRDQSDLVSTVGTGISLGDGQCDDPDTCNSKVRRKDDRLAYRHRLTDYPHHEGHTEKMSSEKSSSEKHTSKKDVNEDEDEDEEPIDLSLFADADQVIEDDE